MLHVEEALSLGLRLAAFGCGSPPRIDGRFEVRRILGSGAYGVVVRARDGKLQRDVAVKIYPEAGGTGAVGSADEEAQAAARFRHPHVVEVHDTNGGALELPDRTLRIHYTVMTYVDGRNLRAFQAEGRSRKEILGVLYQVADALGAAHAARLVHGDVKPENVVVALDEEGGPHAYLVDFGLARDPARPDGEPGTVGGTPGTPVYMAPEVLRGEVTPAADQYAFAVMAWEMLTGALPEAVAKKDLRLRAASRARGRRLPFGLRWTLRRAMAPDPERRFRTMADLVDAMRGGGPPVLRRTLLGTFAGGATILLLALALHVQERKNRRLLERAGRPAVQCPAIDGRYTFETIVVRARAERLVGAKGYYRLTARGVGNCRARVEVRKVGDSKSPDYGAARHLRDAAEVELIPDGGGGVRFHRLFRLANGRRTLRYRFTIRVRPDGAIDGAWTLLAADETSSLSDGVLQGRRVGDGEVRGEHAILIRRKEPL